MSENPSLGSEDHAASLLRPENVSSSFYDNSDVYHKYNSHGGEVESKDPKREGHCDKMNYVSIPNYQAMRMNMKHKKSVEDRLREVDVCFHKGEYDRRGGVVVCLRYEEISGEKHPLIFRSEPILRRDPPFSDNKAVTKISPKDSNGKK